MSIHVGLLQVQLGCQLYQWQQLSHVASYYWSVLLSVLL